MQPGLWVLVTCAFKPQLPLPRALGDRVTPTPMGHRQAGPPPPGTPVVRSSASFLGSFSMEVGGWDGTPAVSQLCRPPQKVLPATSPEPSRPHLTQPRPWISAGRGSQQSSVS